MPTPACAGDRAGGIREGQDEDGDEVENLVFPGELEDRGDRRGEKDFSVRRARDAVEDVPESRLHRGNQPDC